jgi:hypothetical protein
MLVVCCAPSFDENTKLAAQQKSRAPRAVRGCVSR